MKLAVLGDPVAHSRSPAIFTAAFAATGIDGRYEALGVDEHGVRNAFSDLRRGSWDGFNITMPYKALAASLCDRVDQAAARAQSVNTIVRRNDAVIGYSTDVDAVLVLMERLPPGNPTLVLGAGGAAAAALVALAGQASSIYIAARRFGAGTQLGERLQVEVGEVKWGVPVVLANVINCTPLGMRAEQLPVEVVDLAGGLLDLPYASSPTPAVARAEEREIAVVDGLEFLVTQAALGFRLWTGKEPPIEAMRQAVENDSSD